VTWLSKVYAVGHRKALMSLGAVTLVTVYAYVRGASFSEYATAVEWILGIAVTGHVAQQATGKAEKAPMTAKAAALLGDG
jgi:hypothetical protein